MPRSTPHHRRKAGSGPPATALIAWIGTDRRHRRATAEGARGPNLRPPARFRSARNVAASVALVCGAVLAVTVGIAETVLAPRGATTTPPMIPQDHQAAPPAPTEQADPHPMVAPIPAAPVPAAAQPAPVRQAPQPITVAPATEHAAQPVTPAAAEPAPQPAAAEPAAGPRIRIQPDAPDASAQRRTTAQADDAPAARSTRTARSSQRSPSAREARPGLGSTVNRVTESLGSAVGLR